MKKLFSISLMAIIAGTFLFTIPSCAQNNVKKWPVSDQVGMYSYRVKELIGYTASDSHGQISKKIVIKRNQNDDIIEKMHFDKFDKVKLKFSYGFDSENRLVQKVKQSPEGKALRTYNYFYDNNNRLFKQTYSDADGVLIKTHYYYFNRRGERIRKTTRDNKGRLKSIRLYIFDGHDRRVRDYSLSRDGDISGTVKYFYDETGCMTKIEFFNDKFELRDVSMFTLDSLGRRIKKERFDSNGDLKSMVHYHYKKN